MARFQLKRVGCETQPITPRPKSTNLAHRKYGIRLQDSGRQPPKRRGQFWVHFWDPKMVPQSFLNTTLLLPASGESPTKAGSVLPRKKDKPSQQRFACTAGWALAMAFNAGNSRCRGSPWHRRCGVILAWPWHGARERTRVREWILLGFDGFIFGPSKFQDCTKNDGRLLHNPKSTDATTLEATLIPSRISNSMPLPPLEATMILS